MHVAVHYLPQFVAETELAGRAVVIVDLLRASTTICQALASGAECVVPCVEVDETWAKSRPHERSRIVLGGERGGKRIAGFDLGNSPTDYSPDQVFGRTVFFTTTNGTRALAHAHLARRVLIGAAVNRRALVSTIAKEARIEILCAGTGGNVTREDVLAAGAIVDQLSPTAEQTNHWAAAAVPAPYNPGLKVGSAMLLTAVVRKSLSPHTMGDECASPGMATLNRIPLPVLASHSTGKFILSNTPEA